MCQLVALGHAPQLYVFSNLEYFYLSGFLTLSCSWLAPCCLLLCCFLLVAHPSKPPHGFKGCFNPFNWKISNKMLFFLVARTHFSLKLVCCFFICLVHIFLIIMLLQFSFKHFFFFEVSVRVMNINSGWYLAFLQLLFYLRLYQKWWANSSLTVLCIKYDIIEKTKYLLIKITLTK